ncbi:hypothetical protein PROAA_660005 [Candidatus Propionivibrio aalborgensis]|uniref:Uncharacterized protein n=2 Tax=Candidatus Propionivibrio aalborgensis TaxID=1860101 RepID=A0A1A8Y1F6_9RHOO|nr:hypothetical protein PROAA_660005 [Candidatus Propionivibrio aalborgensis]
MHRAYGIAEPAPTRARNWPDVRVRKSGNELADRRVAMNSYKVTLIEIETALAELMAAPKRLAPGPYREGGSDVEQPFVIEMDALPLLTFIEDVSRGARVYEFLTMCRPGDILNYLRVRPVAVNSRLAGIFDEELKALWRKPQNRDCGDGYLALTDFDAHFRWKGDDTWPEARCWLTFREKPYWNDLLTNLLKSIRRLQEQLRLSNDHLLHDEVKRIDSGTHVRDFLPEIQRCCRSEPVAPAETKLSGKLFAAIHELIAKDDVRSVSSDFVDYWFWRILVDEQLRRCELAGQKEPQAAFALSGPDGEVGNVPFSDWGGYVHTPDEGACLADLFIMPGWRHCFPESDTEGGMLTDILYPPRQGVAQEQCRFLMIKRDLGALKCARRTEIGDGWFLYESKRPYQPNLKFRNTLVNEPFGAPESSIQFEMGCEAYGSPLLPWRQYGYLGDS